LVEKNPVMAIEKIKVIDTAPEVFTPEQLAQLLNAAPAELLPGVTIQALAGLRTAELLRLEWREVDQTRGFITVSAKKAKTAKRRLIPLASNLAEWLRPYADKTGLLWGKGFRSYHVALRNLAAEIGLAHWPNNGLRHSFASYHLAKHQKAPQLALEMGHSTPRMVFDNYREVVAPAEAESTGSSAQTLLPTTSSGSRRPHEPPLGAFPETPKTCFWRSFVHCSAGEQNEVELVQRQSSQVLLRPIASGERAQSYRRLCKLPP
jgi:Phage integrase family